jgi:Transmembrane secretion effector
MIARRPWNNPVDPAIAAHARCFFQRAHDGDRLRQPVAFEPSRLVTSWMEHLRQHERVTNADRLQQEAVLRFQSAGEPKVTHFIAAEP